MTVLAVAVALAAVSHLRGLLFGRIGAATAVYVRSEYGKLVIHAHRTDAGELPRWLAATWRHDVALGSGIGGWWRYARFNYARGGTRGGNPVHQLAIPYCVLAVLGIATWMGLRTWKPRCVPSQ